MYGAKTWCKPEEQPFSTYLDSQHNIHCCRYVLHGARCDCEEDLLDTFFKHAKLPACLRHYRNGLDMLLLVRKMHVESPPRQPLRKEPISEAEEMAAWGAFTSQAS